MSKNVLLLADSFESGGSERQAILLARLLRHHGRYRPYLACLQLRGSLLHEAEQAVDTSIAEFSLKSFYHPSSALQMIRFVRYLRQNRIEVVHTRDFYTNVFGIVGATIAGVRFRVAYRGETSGWRSNLQNVLERLIFRLAHVVHANSEAVREYLIESGVPSSHVRTIYNGFETARVEVPANLTRDEALTRLALPLGKTVVTIVANLHHSVKNVPMFLRAAQRVSAVLPSCIFVVAGEGKLLEEFLQLAADLVLEHAVYFLGRCDKIAELLYISDVCVLTSNAEGFSNAILEYMAAGRPVVATAVGGAPEAVRDGETGYLVPPGDYVAMAERIVNLLRDPQRASEMGAAGRKRVLEQFSSATQLHNTELLYSEGLEP